MCSNSFFDSPGPLIVALLLGMFLGAVLMAQDTDVTKAARQQIISTLILPEGLKERRVFLEQMVKAQCVSEAEALGLMAR